MGFQGYSPETFDFLWGLRFNNNRAWFTEHKKDYVNYLYEPTKELGADLFSAFENIPGLGYRVSRIYKDVRFSKGDPYKESLWISIRRSADSWDAESTLYFEIRPEDCHYGLVFWRPESGLMQAFREDIAARPEVLDMILSCEREAGCLLEGDPYVRRKIPAPRPELERFYSLKGFYASVHREPGDLLFSPELVPEVVRTLKALMPINEYFQKLTTSYRQSSDSAE